MNWINVKNELPSKFELVLTFFKTDTREYYQVCYYDGKKWNRETVPSWINYNLPITHWMVLPISPINNQ